MASTADLLKAALADRYRIEREVGQGGMATVYLAEDLKHRRKVAVKVLRPEIAATLGSDRFFREIEVAAQLQHPHILPLLDSGETQGFYYYVMPYVVGESLRERLSKGGELPIHDAVKILSEVVDALAAAHAMGVVHRDIKPDNVMLSGRHALVTDFGVAKAVSEATGRNQLTTAGVALGTPAYMAPEQAAADPHIDHRVDIYAVGAMGYELLTGKPPFTGGTAAEILGAHVTRAPEPVTTRRTACPPALGAVIMRCLEKRPADRWQSAEELLNQLEPLATPSGGMTPTQTRPVEVVPPSGKSRAIRAAAAVMVVAAMLAIGAVLKGRSAPEASAVLRDRTQLTSTGRVSYPAISRDGKQLAYAVSTCKGGSCSYGVELQDVGGSETRRLFEGASALYSIEWSADRRNLILSGTVGGHYGSFIASIVGGSPKPAGALATFWAGGDSLLLTTFAKPDSGFWIGVAGLEGVARDSIWVRASGAFGGAGGATPNSSWFIAVAWRSPFVDLITVDRQGREGSRVSVRASDVKGTRATADALWTGLRQVGSPVTTIVRAPLDISSGRIAQRFDTMYVGQVTSFDVTADGGELILDEGTIEYDVWSMELKDALAGKFDEKRRLNHSTSNVAASVSPDGGRVLVLRTTASSPGYSAVTMPLEGGAEVPLRTNGLLTSFWGDASTVQIAEREASGTRLSLLDVRSGQRRTSIVIPDSTIADFAAASDGDWVWIARDGRDLFLYKHQGEARRSLAIPDWYEYLIGVSMSPAGDKAAIVGWNAGSADSVVLGVMSLDDGKTTRWVAESGENGGARWLPDGSVAFWVWRTQQTLELFRVRGPGQIESLGVVPRPVALFSVSTDLRRAVLVTQDRHGDVWKSRVVR